MFEMLDNVYTGWLVINGYQPLAICTGGEIVV